MNANLHASYQLMRFNVLNSTRDGISKSPFTPGYIYAWDHGVYPAFDERSEWHKPFSEMFSIKEEEVVELGKHLDTLWLEKKTISFYELEDHYDVNGHRSPNPKWDRVKLLFACRYMALNRMFDSSFWSAVTKNGDCPSEALHLADPLKDENIYFL